MSVHFASDALQVLSEPSWVLALDRHKRALGRLAVFQSVYMAWWWMRSMRRIANVSLYYRFESCENKVLDIWKCCRCTKSAEKWRHRKYRWLQTTVGEGVKTFHDSSYFLETNLRTMFSLQLLCIEGSSNNWGRHMSQYINATRRMAIGIQDRRLILNYIDHKTMFQPHPQWQNIRSHLTTRTPVHV